ncbi:MAG TPA: glutaminase A [Lamprocystis sp. (in: g-proteobacteria)]|nr:glutaminase A [Lamprocystis sp. (in: g-proteobacteria)]
MAVKALVDSPIQKYLEALHGRVAALREGDLASYIPELTSADPEWFGIAIATVDGHVYQVGDSRQAFTIQSISKPFVYGLALADLGVERVLAKVGVEPSGEAFNSISLEPGTGRPLNPMINAGAIATTCMITGDSPQQREQRILEMFARYTGHPMVVDDRVYASEARTGHRNRALAHLMRNFDVIETDPEPGLDLYFRQCSVLVNCRDLALMGACLANNGVNPVTGVRALPEAQVARVLSVMSSCGMYDYSGGWIYSVGMPAKSGVGGGIVAVLPGQVGIAVFSPLLDARGNSCRGIRVCEEISRDFDLHLFHASRSTSAAIIRARYDARLVGSQRRRRLAERDLLAQHGARVRVYELQGELTIGATESLIHEVLNELAGVEVLILDLARVVNVDQAAARMLTDLARDLTSGGCTVLIPGAANKHAFMRLVAHAWPQSRDLGAFQFTDSDHALEWAEDRLLATLAPPVDPTQETALADNDLCVTLSPEERAGLAAIAQRLEFAAGAPVFRTGEAADALFLIAQGRFEVLLPAPGQPPRRLSTLSPGMYFGELPLASGQPRSADVVARDGGACWRVPFAAIEAGLKIRLLSTIASRLAERLAEQARVQRLVG